MAGINCSAAYEHGRLPVTPRFTYAITRESRQAACLHMFITPSYCLPERICVATRQVCLAILRCAEPCARATRYSWSHANHVLQVMAKCYGTGVISSC